jgi:site-specific DNA-methyltransferase (adenine-specific)
MSTPYYASDRATVYQGDALAVLAGLPAGSVDAVITDPPYSSGGQFRGDRIQDVHTKYVQTSSTSGAALPDFSGDNRDQRGYAYWCALWLSECLRLTTPGGVVAMFTDWRQLPTTTDAIQSGGWVWRGILPWHKPNGRMTQGRPANSCEYIAWGTAGPRTQDGSHETLPGFLQSSTLRDVDRYHIAEKPLPVMRALVHVARDGATVLDPFAGSGTTGVAALIEGRRFIGIEQHPHHCATIATRLDRARMVDRPEQDVLPLGVTP